MDKREIGRISENSTKIFSLVLTDDEESLFYGTTGNHIKEWDLESREIKDTLRGHMGAIWCLKLSQDQRYLFSGSADGTLKIWDRADANRKIFSVDHGTKVLDLVIGCLNKTLVFAGANIQPVKFLDLKKRLKSGKALKKSASRSRKKKIRKSPKSPKKTRLKLKRKQEARTDRFKELENETSQEESPTLTNTDKILQIIMEKEEYEKPEYPKKSIQKSGFGFINGWQVPEHIQSNKNFQKNVENYQEWLDTLPPESVNDAMSLLVFISMEQERNLQLSEEVNDLIMLVQERETQLKIKQAAEGRLVDEVAQLQVKTQTGQNQASQNAKKEMKAIAEDLQKTQKNNESLENENQLLKSRLGVMEQEFEKKKQELLDKNEELVFKFNEGEVEHKKEKTRIEHENQLLRRRIEDISSTNNQLHITLEETRRQRRVSNLGQTRKMEQEYSLLLMQTKSFQDNINQLKSEIIKRDHDLQYYRQLTNQQMMEQDSLSRTLEMVQRGSYQQGSEDPIAKKLISHLERDLTRARKIAKDWETRGRELERENDDLRRQVHEKSVNLQHMQDTQSHFESKMKNIKTRNEGLISEIEKIRKHMVNTYSEPTSYQEEEMTMQNHISFKKSKKLYSNTGRLAKQRKGNFSRTGTLGYGNRRGLLKRSRSSAGVKHATDHFITSSEKEPFDDSLFKVPSQIGIRPRFNKSKEKNYLVSSWIEKN